MHFVKTPIGVAGQTFDAKCRSYDPGHAPHGIQLRNEFESNQVRAVWVGIELPSTAKFSIDGVVKTISNHHPQTIQNLVTIHPSSNLAWVEAFRVLIFETVGSEGFAFNLSRSPIEACAE